MKKKISVVIPTYNEEGNVKPLAESIVAVMETELPEYRYEILFIRQPFQGQNADVSAGIVRKE